MSTGFIIGENAAIKITEVYSFEFVTVIFFVLKYIHRKSIVAVDKSISMQFSAFYIFQSFANV